MYKDVIFLKFYGNSNAMTKFLFEERLKTTQTPAFSFFRTGGDTYNMCLPLYADMMC